MSDGRIKPFRVPDLGEGLEEVTVTQWHVAIGDDVELNQVLCTVETAKAEVEIPSPYAGRIVERNGAEGDTVSVGAVLLQIDDLQAPTTLSLRLFGGADRGADQ
ncbi:biotin/lipoyl-containing protein, partial [Mycobacterium sp. 1165178.9]|uniref:biotin/lipoyl-containing protein n=1 Tax=Mycobacterium sp. 1165178.9 TaxID=1834070 RepID=UPI000ABDAE6D